MTTRFRFDFLLRWFPEHMPDPQSELRYDNPFQLLVAVMLSAQCTDKRVNMVTPALFEAYPTPERMAEASVEQNAGEAAEVSQKASADACRTRSRRSPHYRA